MKLNKFKKIAWTISAILSIGLLIITIIQKSQEFFCVKKQGEYAVGKVIKVRGRETKTVDHADFIFFINEKEYSGSTMLKGEKEFKKSVNKGVKFLVIFCPERPRDNILILSYPLPSDLNEIKNLRIDATKIEFNLLDLKPYAVIETRRPSMLELFRCNYLLN